VERGDNQLDGRTRRGVSRARANGSHDSAYSVAIAARLGGNANTRAAAAALVLFCAGRRRRGPSWQRRLFACADLVLPQAGREVELLALVAGPQRMCVGARQWRVGGGGGVVARGAIEAPRAANASSEIGREDVCPEAAVLLGAHAFAAEPTACQTRIVARRARLGGRRPGRLLREHEALAVRLKEGRLGPVRRDEQVVVAGPEEHARGYGRAVPGRLGRLQRSDDVSVRAAAAAPWIGHVI